MYLAIKEIKKDKGRFILIIGIIALISYLVLFLTGLAYGLSKDNMTGIEKWRGKQIILKNGSNSNAFSSSIDMELAKTYESYNHTKINLSRTIAYKNGNKNKENNLNIVLVGFESIEKVDIKVIEGDYPKDRYEVIGSISLKEENGLNVGDKIVLSSNDKEYTIVGFTPESKISVSSVIYTNFADASNIAMNFKTDKETDSTTGATKNTPQRVSAIILHDTTDIKSNDVIEILSISELIEELPGYKAQNLTFGMMIIFLIIISSIVLGVFMYILTMQKKSIFGVMKVQGISNNYISNTVILQTIIVSFTGIMIGLSATLLSEAILPNKVPFQSNYYIYGGICLFILLTSLIGSIFSVNSVKKVDPLNVIG